MNIGTTHVLLGNSYGQMILNAAESWNNQIRDEMVRPILSLVDGLRQYFHNRIGHKTG